MQTPAWEAGACVEIDPTAQLFDGAVAGGILLNERTQHKRLWLTIVRAWRSDRDQRRLERHRRRLAHHLRNVEFLEACR